MDSKMEMAKNQKINRRNLKTRCSLPFFLVKYTPRKGKAHFFVPWIGIERWCSGLGPYSGYNSEKRA